MALLSQYPLCSLSRPSDSTYENVPGEYLGTYLLRYYVVWFGMT